MITTDEKILKIQMIILVLSLVLVILQIYALAIEKKDLLIDKTILGKMLGTTSTNSDNNQQTS